MEIALWQVIVLTLYSGYQILDELHIVSSAGSAVFAGFFTGLVMGDVVTGLAIGAQMQLTILGVGTFGGASRIDANSGTIIATAFSIALGMDPEQALAAIGVPVAALMIQTDVLARFANTFFAHRIDTAIENHDYASIERNYLLGALPWALSRMIPVFIALALGGEVVDTIVNYINTNIAWLGTGLSVAGAALPAVGFAILMRSLPVKKHLPYLILGFTLTALLSVVFNNIQVLGGTVTKLAEDFQAVFNALPMLAVALIGFSLAIIHYKNESEKLRMQGLQAVGVVGENAVTSEEGEILDDEL